MGKEEQDTNIILTFTIYPPIQLGLNAWYNVWLFFKTSYIYVFPTFRDIKRHTLFELLQGNNQTISLLSAKS